MKREFTPVGLRVECKRFINNVVSLLFTLMLFVRNLETNLKKTVDEIAAVENAIRKAKNY